jgi:hypothetical protein
VGQTNGGALTPETKAKNIIVNKVKNKKMKTNNCKIRNIAVIIAFVASGLMAGCQKEENVYNSPDLLDNSSLEIEEYIIAGLDYQHTLNLFNKEIQTIDFLKLSTHQDSQGNMIVNIPISVSIEEKILIFNEKKKLLLEKCPQIASLAPETICNYFQGVARNSSNITRKILDLGLDINTPRLKKGTVETFNNSSEYYTYLASYVNNSNYVETFIVIFTNGTAITYTDNRNTSSTCYSPGFTQSNGQWYVNGYPDKPVARVAHTHIYSNTPSPADIAFKNNHPGLSTGIYYSGAIYSY